MPYLFTFSSNYILTYSLCTASLYGSAVCTCHFNSEVIGWSSCKHLSWINWSLPFKNQITIKLLWPFFVCFLSISSHNMAKAKTITKRKSIQSLKPHTNHGMETAQDNLPQSPWKITIHLLTNSHHAVLSLTSSGTYCFSFPHPVLNNTLNEVSDVLYC